MADTMQPTRKDPSIRKNNKPLMEKRRRARINSCLGQLKSLVLQAMKKDSSQFSKLEKADILELTLKHLRALQRQQMTSAASSDPNVMTKYRAGFNECANEVIRYMGAASSVSEDIRGRLVGHLANCMQTVNGVPQNENIPQRHMQPLQVQIPSTAPYHKPHTVPSSTPVSSLCHTPITSSSSNQSTVTSPSLTPRMVSPNENHPRLSGSFQLVPGNMCNGNSVAVYVPSQNNGSVPVYSLQVPSMNNGLTAFVPSPTDLKQHSPIQYDQTYFKMDSEKHHYSYGISPVCSPSHAALKEEKVWRPW
ncbi:transcription factor HES-4-A [Patella vulgata]|uniref:transcription factor HES-4-A n=1 Tax=Patella vulgata TaxID=6465 RepID=UPI00217F6933|nr:transcription factor HES-4-A [Patella vulgata]